MVVDFVNGVVLLGKVLVRSSISFVLFQIILLGLQLLSIEGTLLSWSWCLLLVFMVRRLALRDLNGATVAPFLMFPSLLVIIPFLSWLLRKRFLLPSLFLHKVLVYGTLA
jgi:hypothetical protein